MYTRDHYFYYQPQYKVPVDDELLPNGLWSFQAFLTPDTCKKWLLSRGYNPDDFTIEEYKDDDIEEVTIIDYDNAGGERILDRIEELLDEEIADRLIDTVLWHHGEENLRVHKGENESQQAFDDRIYGWARDLVDDAIAEIENNNDYNFQLYAGDQDQEWYDEGREIAVHEILAMMTEDEVEV